MVIDKCYQVLDRATVFSVRGDIPSNTNAIILDGVEYEVFPAYGYPEEMYVIQGIHDLQGKDVKFVKRIKQYERNI